MAESEVTLVAPVSGVRTLKDIEVPEKFFRRMALGVQVLDEIFGGQDWPGILPGSSILFTGMPGAGKSTAALQFADLLQRNAGRCVLYNCGEENEFMVKLRADRLGIGANFGLSVITDVDELIKTCKDSGVEVLFQDSLQSIRCKDAADTREAQLKAVTKKLHRFAKDDDVSVWIVGHITKGGDFAGPMEVKHDVDVHAHIRLNPDSMAREFMLTKNRFGPAGIPYECNLGARGLDFAALQLVENKPEDGAKGSSRASERREQVDKVIKEALLRGEKLSRYCYSRLGVDCSGGFWGARLEKVAHQLRAESHVIGESVIDGRRHIFVEI